MKRQHLWLLVPALLFVVIAVVDNHRRQTPAYILAHYPHDQTFGNVVANHLDNPKFAPNSPREAVFLAAWFDAQTPAWPSRCFVRRNGEGEFWVQHNASPMDIRTNSNRDFQFDSSQLAAMSKLLRALPPSAKMPLLDDLLMLSFWENQKWTTRIYNRSQLPVEVVRLYRIVGIPGLARTADAQGIY